MYSVEEKYNMINVRLLFSVKPSKTIIVMIINADKKAYQFLGSHSKKYLILIKLTEIRLLLPFSD